MIARFLAGRSRNFAFIESYPRVAGSTSQLGQIASVIAAQGLHVPQRSNRGEVLARVACRSAECCRYLGTPPVSVVFECERIEAARPLQDRKKRERPCSESSQRISSPPRPAPPTRWS